MSILITCYENSLLSANKLLLLTMIFTGAAANNVGGKTMHSMYSVNCNHPRNQLSETQKQILARKLRRTLVLIMDERSMISSSLLGASARNCSQTALGGLNQNQSWGGIPIVILVGDDHQLPPVVIKGQGKGALWIKTGRENCSNSNWGAGVETLGVSQFLELSDVVVKLNKVERQDESDQDHTQLLDNLRPPNMLTPAQVRRLINLHINNIEDTKKREEIEWSAMHVYAAKKDARDYNLKCLVHHSNDNNPVAMIKNKGVNKSSKNGKAVYSHFVKDQIPMSTMFCRDSRVCIKGRNFMPEWGLYNGAMGTVVEIVFQENESPNDNHQPLYVAVRFDGYTGPAWDPTDPKLVPIPIIKLPCTKGARCCMMSICPLALSHATTIHKFQGQSVGPTKEGQPNNAIQVIVCCPGGKSFEGKNPGLLYTLCTRATTFGDEGKQNSAMFFIGDHICKKRFENVHLTAEGHKYQLVTYREKWIAHLESRIIPYNITNQEKNELMEWATTKDVTFTEEHIDECIMAIGNHFEHIHTHRPSTRRS